MSPSWKIYIDVYLIEKGICLTWNVCVWLKLVILLNPKKVYTFFQQRAGEVINCIFSNIFIPYRLIILYFLICTKINIFYFILGCKLILIGILSFLDSSSWPWSVVWPMLSNELDRNIYIYTDPRQWFCLRYFFCIYILCILEKYEKFVNY